MAQLDPARMGAHVLVVDDTPANVQYLGRILKDHGFQINIATDGASALDTARKVVPDLILLDIMMPEMDGFETCRRLKAEPALRKIPVIFLTARTEVDDIVKGFDCGGVDYITKPFHPSELLARVRTQLELKHLRDELAGLADQLLQKNRELTDSLGKIAKMRNALLTICAWTKQVKVDDKWVGIDEYLTQYLGLKLTHGMSDEALATMRAEIDKLEAPGSESAAPSE